MTIDKVVPSLGRGIYRVADVARYTKIPHTTIRSWFNSLRLFESDFVRVDKADCISFLDLIDTLVAHQFRTHGVGMKMVRKAYNRLKDDLQVEHPFCHRGLYTDGKEIIVNAAEHLGAPSLREAVSRQHLLEHMQHVLHQVSYDEASRLAQWWNIADGVILHPAIAMGEPVINGTGLTTHVVYSVYRANGGNREIAAGIYGLSAKQVDRVVAFEKSIRPAA